MIILRRFYSRPAHAIRIFDRVQQEKNALGRSLQSITHVYSLGTDIRLCFEFAEVPQTVDYLLIYRLGRLCSAAEVANAGWLLDAVVPMRAAWIPIGGFYLLKKMQ